jgi:hypothetical protein
MVMFIEENADIKTDNSSFEILKDFICMGTTLKESNSIQEEAIRAE